MRPQITLGNVTQRRMLAFHDYPQKMKITCPNQGQHLQQKKRMQGIPVSKLQQLVDLVDMALYSVIQYERNQQMFHILLWYVELLSFNAHKHLIILKAEQMTTKL
jgi:hypothetical protein